jgi:opacity protein-like surface antigen
MLTAVTVTLLLVSAASGTAAQEPPLPLYGQLMVAAFSADDTDENFEGDSFDLTLVGVAAQKPLLADLPVDLGFETGALLSWKNDTRFAQISSGPSGGTIRVEIENQMLLVDYFFGGYAGFRPTRWLRLFAGAGPLLVYGYREIEPEPYNGASPEKTYESKLAIGAYARCGAEIVFTDRCMLGAGVRATTSGLEFKEPVGSIRYEGIQYFLSFSFSL